jgi:hypothetical protein
LLLRVATAHPPSAAKLAPSNTTRLSVRHQNARRPEAVVPGKRAETSSRERESRQFGARGEPGRRWGASAETEARVLRRCRIWDSDTGRGASRRSEPRRSRAVPLPPPPPLFASAGCAGPAGRSAGAGGETAELVERGTTTVEERRRLRVLTSKVRSRTWPCCGAGLRGVGNGAGQGRESVALLVAEEEGDLVGLSSLPEPKKTPESRGVGTGTSSVVPSVVPPDWMRPDSLAPSKVASRARNGAESVGSVSRDGGHVVDKDAAKAIDSPVPIV